MRDVDVIPIFLQNLTQFLEDRQKYDWVVLPAPLPFKIIKKKKKSRIKSRTLKGLAD